MLLVLVLGIDLAQYTPGPNGQSPTAGSAGLVKEAMFDIANEPWLFLLVFPSIAIGAPLAEELIFRGQLFSALSQTRLGVSGATVVTAALLGAAACHRALAVDRPDLRHGAGLRLDDVPLRQPVGDHRLPRRLERHLCAHHLLQREARS